MKKIVSLALGLALLLTLAAAPALAELRRGDKGADVSELQEMLLETGWLFAEPDGIYGRDTEAAVRRYQEYAGLPATGVADDETLSRLLEDWKVLFGVGGEDGEGGEGEAEGDPPVCCVRVDDGPELTAVDCADHQELHQRAEALLSTGAAEDAEKACELWQENITGLYDRWMRIAAPADRLDIIAARANFFTWAEKQRVALAALYQEDPQYMYWQLEELLHAQAGRVCQLLWTIDGEGGGE